MLLCLPHAQMNSNRYWNSAMNLSFPLLLARNSEKKMEKLLVFMKISFVSSFVILLVMRAWWPRSFSEPTLLNDIANYNQDSHRLSPASFPPR
jgi:uncharacterized membrane protein